MPVDATVIGLAVGRPQRWGFLDRIEIDRIGIVRLIGWSHDRTAAISPPTLSLDGHALPPLKLYRYQRPDVPAQPGRAMRQTGVVVEHRIPPDLMNAERDLASIAVDGESLRIGARFSPIAAHYDALFETNQVYQREHIYAVGPPNPEVNPEVMAQLEAVGGSVLDFGCGSGALVAWLRARQVEANGIEIDHPIIRTALLPAAAPHVTLYDGRNPLPFPDAAFDLVIASEVLEHISDFQGAIAELARICHGRALITVPDSEAIPIGYPHHLVPWHLLESTHLNFFTQRSLEAQLSPYFASIEFGRIGRVRLNGSYYYESIVALASKE